MYIILTNFISSPALGVDSSWILKLKTLEKLTVNYYSHIVVDESWRIKINGCVTFRVFLNTVAIKPIYRANNVRLLVALLSRNFHCMQRSRHVHNRRAHWLHRWHMCRGGCLTAEHKHTECNDWQLLTPPTCDFLPIARCSYSNSQQMNKWAP